jgi:hypothetical protein
MLMLAHKTQNTVHKRLRALFRNVVRAAVNQQHLNAIVSPLPCFAQILATHHQECRELDFAVRLQQCPILFRVFLQRAIDLQTGLHRTWLLECECIVIEIGRTNGGAVVNDLVEEVLQVLAFFAGNQKLREIWNAMEHEMEDVWRALDLIVESGSR